MKSGPPLLAVILLAIDVAASAADLAEWWAAHQAALKRLPPIDLEVAIAAKDRAKRRLT